MRFMETVRKKGATGIWIFAGVMLLSIVGGLGVGAFYSPMFQGSGNAEIGAAGGKLPVVSRDGRFEGVAMFVNDRPVTLNEFAANLEFMTRNYLQNRNDYELLLQIYGEATRKLVRDEVLLEYGEQFDVTVTEAEVEEERNKIIDNYLAGQDETTGNVVGDLALNLSKSKARREAFRTFLSRSGMDNAIWEQNVQRSLLVTNCQNKIVEVADAEKEQKMNETRLLIDERLAAGELFSELAREFSDDNNAENGGDLNTWVFPGLIQDEANDDALFSTPVGETTDWFEIPAGLQRFQVYEKREAEGPEFEEKKPELIQDIRDEKGEDYEPTDEEVANLYRSVKARQIQLNKTDPAAAYEKIGNLVSEAKVEINLPYVLAYQALMDDRLYTAADVSFEDLKLVASNAHVGENFDFEIMRPKWDNRLPKPAADEEAEAGTEDAADSALEAVDEIIAADEAANAEAADESDTSGDGSEAAEDVEAVASIEEALVEQESAVTEADETTPLYALAIGYLKMGQKDEGDTPSMFSYWLVADTYMEWLETEDRIIGQQVDRSAARQEIEENLAQVTESDNYNAAAYAARGLNLAWLDRADEAREQLATALKYVANSDSMTLDLIEQGYNQLDDEDGLATLEELRQAARQAELEKAISEAQNNPGSSIPFGEGTLQLPDISDLEGQMSEDVAGDTATDTGTATDEAGEAAGEGTAATEDGSGGDETPAGDDAPADPPAEDPAGQ